MAFGLKKTKFRWEEGGAGLKKARKTTGTEQLADGGGRGGGRGGQSPMISGQSGYPAALLHWKGKHSAVVIEMLHFSRLRCCSE